MNTFILSILEQGLIFSIMVIGVYITYRILDFPDLSVDGTFALGGAVTASLLTHGMNPFLSCFISLILGTLGGVVTGILNVKLKITNLLSGILVMMGLYSINLRIMGKANAPLFNSKTIFSSGIEPVIIIGFFALAAKFTLDLFLKTKYGFLLKAAGDNPKMVTSLGINTGTVKIVGIAISNGLVALSGSIMAQYQGFSDVGMGSGIVIMGLASIIFGQSVFKKVSFILPTTMALMGSILYKSCIAIALKIGLAPTDLKLITSIIIIIALSINGFKFGFRPRKILTLGGDKRAADAKYM